MRGRLALCVSLLVALAVAGACTESDPATLGSDEIEVQEDAGSPQDPSEPQDTSEEDTSEQVAPGQAEWSALAQLAAADIDALLNSMVPTWEGFDPANHPTVVLLVEDDESITTGFTVNHPAPAAVGSATPVDGQDGVFYVSEFVRPVQRPGNGLFDFDVEVGGVPSYVIVTNADEYAGNDSWRGLFMHEMFHLHQRSWSNRRFVGQGEPYDFSPENIELLLLENAALVAASDASTADEATQALAQFNALRAARLDSFTSTELDKTQEAAEGTAQWFEWRSIGRTEPMYQGPPGDTSLADPESISSDPWVYLSFRRFYLTGATIMELLDRQGVNWHPAIEAGASPAELLADLVAVDPADHETLIDQARQRADPDGQLADLAQRWSEAAIAAFDAASDQQTQGGDG